MNLLGFFVVFVGWLGILGQFYWSFVCCKFVVLGYRILLVRIVDGLWGILRGVLYVFVDV